MRNRLLRVTAVLFAAALTGILACSSSDGGGGCGGSSSNSNNASTSLATFCGAGTVNQNGVCVKSN